MSVDFLDFIRVVYMVKRYFELVFGYFLNFVESFLVVSTVFRDTKFVSLASLHRIFYVSQFSFKITNRIDSPPTLLEQKCEFFVTDRSIFIFVKVDK